MSVCVWDEREGGGGLFGIWYLTSQSEKSFPSSVGVCVSVPVRRLRQHTQSFRDASSVLVCSVCSRGYLYTVRCGGTPLALSLRGVKGGDTHSLPSCITHPFPHTFTCNTQFSFEQVPKYNSVNWINKIYFQDTDTPFGYIR